MGLDPTPGINAGLPDEASGVSNDGRSRGTLATYGNSGGQVGPIQSVEPSRRSRVLPAAPVLFGAPPAHKTTHEGRREQCTTDFR